MAGMEGFGAEGVGIPLASGVHIDMTNAQSVLFVGYEDGGATDVVFKQSIDGTGTTALSNITRFFTSNGIGGAWEENTMTAGDTVEPNDDTDNDGWAVEILASQLSDGFNHVECTPDAGTCVAYVRQLNVGRSPANIGVTGIAEVS